MVGSEHLVPDQSEHIPGLADTQVKRLKEELFAFALSVQCLLNEALVPKHQDALNQLKTHSVPERPAEYLEESPVRRRELCLESADDQFYER